LNKEEINKLSGTILDSAIEVHKQLGPGLLESVCEICLCRELEPRKIRFLKQVPIPIIYKGEKLNYDYRIDMLVENEIIIELKSVDILHPVFDAQLLTYLRLSNKRLINGYF